MVIFLIIFAAATLAAICTIAATILSSRINHTHSIVETYDARARPQNGKGFIPRTYPIKVQA